MDSKVCKTKTRQTNKKRELDGSNRCHIKGKRKEKRNHQPTIRPHSSPLKLLHIIIFPFFVCKILKHLEEWFEEAQFDALSERETNVDWIE
jgi:hypothetical protein